MMKRSMSLLAFSMMLLAAVAQGFQQPKVDVSEISSQSWTDVDYVGDGIEGHKLDVYMPKTASNPKVIITIYGSAWFANNAKSACMGSIGKALLEAGYAVVTINHRSSPEAVWPAQIQDVKAAIRYVRANAAKYGYDASFVGITGFSSGGHLSTTAAVTNGVTTMKHGALELDFEGSLGDFTATSSRVDGVVDWFGPVDMVNVSDWKGHGGDKAPESVLIGNRAPSQEPDWSWLISPVFFVNKTAPEILIIHGDDDHVVGNAQSHHLKDAYDKAGVKATLIDVPGGDHGPGCFEPQYYMEMIRYFDRMSGTQRSADFRLSTQGSQMVSPSTRQESNNSLEEVLTININIDPNQICNVKAGERSVNMIPFGGQAEGKYFSGKVLAGGVDTQKYVQKQGQQMPDGTLSARYMLQGKDQEGNACKIFIENNGKFGEEFTHPVVITDSPALSFLNTAELKGKLDFSNQQLVIRIFCPM